MTAASSFGTLRADLRPSPTRAIITGSSLRAAIDLAPVTREARKSVRTLALNDPAPAPVLRPLLNAASFNEHDRVAVGVFSIPKRKRKNFRAVTEVHYLNACNELVRFLMGRLTSAADPAVCRHMRYEDFERDKYRFHKAKIEDLKFEKLIGPNESFTIALEVQRIKKANGRFYAQFGVSNAVTGHLLYCYNPDESR
jgi:hypothetical protein